MGLGTTAKRLRAFLLALFWLPGFASLAQQPNAAATITAQPAPACQPAAAVAMQRRTQVAAYYDLKLALVSGRVFEWRSGAPLRVVTHGAVQVAVGQARGYAVDTQRRLISWEAGSTQTEVLLDDTVWVAAGDSAVFAIRCDGSLWQRAAAAAGWTRVADAVVHAWVGDGADYYVAASGELFVRGKAQRGQYGDGKLSEASGWTRVASDAVAVVAHTGHALYLRRDGAVLGTGGNRFGPLGAHGYGDKADAWGVLFGGASQIATGSRHSLAIRGDGSLWVWGEGVGLLPKRLLSRVVAASGGLDDSIALTADGGLWHWALGKPPARVELPR